MQLKIRRSQKETGMMSKSVIFCLDARAEFTQEEAANISKYKLGGQVVYNSEASKKHLASGDRQIDGSTVGYVKAIGAFALAAMQLNITVNSLTQGQHIECKTLDEVLGAEEALTEACQNLKAYLEAAATFDGRETVLDFSAPQVAAA